MQIFHRSAQGSPQGGQRKAPHDMPTSVPPTRLLHPAPVQQEAMPRQKAITDEAEPVAPAKWKAVLKRVLIVLGLILALSLVYVFLLMGEPDEDGQLTAQTTQQEESIHVPIAATELAGNADINPLASNFGKPVLALYGSSLTLQKATLFDTAFRGGYARRLTLDYAFSDGALLTVVSLRPTAAVSLLGKERYQINMAALYTIAGLDAVRMDSEDTICILARSLDAAYAVLCPVTHASELSALLKQSSLMQSATP